MKRTSHNRLWELDLLRAIAIVFMALYHLLFQINAFVNPLRFSDAFWYFSACCIGGSFLTVAGMSLWVGYQRSDRLRFSQYFKRGGFIFAIGMLITTLSLTVPAFQGPVYFGILHCIGVSVCLGFFFVKKPNASLIGALVVWVLGYAFDTFTVSFPWLLWVGITPSASSIRMADYFPLAPWFGMVLFGIFLGSRLFPDGERKFELPLGKPVRPLVFLGQHSLLIYLVHQPLIYAVLMAYLYQTR